MLGQWAYRLADRLRRLWWRIARPSIRGSAAVLLREDGAVLLVRHSYGSRRWALVGGGIRRKEDPLEAARRECREETGLDPRDLRLVAIVEQDLFGALNLLHLFVGYITGTPRIDGREIVAAEFFAPDALPHDLASQVDVWIARALADQNRSS